MKFIVLKGLDDAGDIPIIFPDFVRHGDVGRVFGEDDIVSAGFVHVYTNGDEVSVEVHGKSTDYPNKPPRPEDDFFLSNAIRKH